MTSKEIRQYFLDYFSARQHRIITSAPVVPHDDPTLLFTNAGMNQFKDVFLATGTREYSRAVNTQKCIRVSGKHNDLEEVGRDTYHHTFFEMLGNWSFGDYYKREAIAWAWELLTVDWNLPKDRLHATVYNEDYEAYSLWTEVTDIDPSHVHRFGAKDNFWEMGDSGPCGPCSEIHIDMTSERNGGTLINTGHPEVMEIWNLVFIQYNRDETGFLHELPKKHVDTGMGLERIVAVMQGKSSNYDTDIFMPLIEAVSRATGQPYEEEQNRTAMRVIADHIRMLAFSIADGAMPGPDGRGYVLRRILRRAARFGRNLGMREPFIWSIVAALTDSMGEAFPELVENQQIIERVIRSEEESFNAALDRGLEIFEDIAGRVSLQGSAMITGEDVFKLYDTYGFPLDLTAMLAEERGLTVDSEGFETLLAIQKERSRAVTKNRIPLSVINAQNMVQLETADDASKSLFIGYDATVANAVVTGVHRDGKMLYIMLDKTPFYVEAGGQVNDSGVLVWKGVRVPVCGLLKQEGGIIHLLEAPADFSPSLGDPVHAEVDTTLRRDTMRNHTATHLLHAALREVLGTHVQQAGSLVDAGHLRFDFSHYKKIAAEQLTEIEQMVNKIVFKGLPVLHHRNIPFDEAKTMGALMFFGDKYGDTVNVLEIPGFSMEFCGGTHVQNTAEIGLFKIVSEKSIASGTHRIEAVTGKGVMLYIERLHSQLDEQVRKATEMQEQLHSAEKKLARHELKKGVAEIDSLLDAAQQVGRSRLVVARIAATGIEQLKAFGDVLRVQLVSGIGLLAAEINGKVQLVCVVTDDLVAEKIRAGAIIAPIAEMLGGGGGGKPHMATAGAKNVSILDEVLEKAPFVIRQMMPI